jgi:hypothetical protein
MQMTHNKRKFMRPFTPVGISIFTCMFLTNINLFFCLSHRFNSHLVLGITLTPKNSIKNIILKNETNSSFSRFWHNFLNVQSNKYINKREKESSFKLSSQECTNLWLKCENHVKEVSPTKLATWKDHYIHSSKRSQGHYYPQLNKSSQPI